jgi:hypothetical protein
MKQETMKVRITRATDDNWYKVDEEYEVLKNLLCTSAGDYYPLPDDKNAGIDPEDCEIVAEKQSEYPVSVLCVDDELAEGYLRKGNVYTVIGEYQDVDYVLKEVKMTWGKSRFEIVSAPANILNAQDNHKEGKIVQQTTIDAHYNFDYKLTEYDYEVAGYLKIDPYFVAKQWRTGERDPSGVIFHILKTCARFGEKNSKEREITAIYKSIKRLAELEGVKLE